MHRIVVLLRETQQDWLFISPFINSGHIRIKQSIWLLSLQNKSNGILNYACQSGVYFEVYEEIDGIHFKTFLITLGYMFSAVDKEDDGEKKHSLQTDFVICAP